MQEADEAAYKQGVEQGTIKPGLGPFGMYQKPKNSGGRATSKRSRPSKADEAGLKLCQFCDRRKPLARFPMRLIMTCKGHAERRLGAHCIKCQVRSMHLRSNGYMRPHAQDILKAYHTVRPHPTRRCKCVLSSRPNRHSSALRRACVPLASVGLNWLSFVANRAVCWAVLCADAGFKKSACWRWWGAAYGG